MYTYIITYDLRKEYTGEKYQKLIELIKYEGVWACLGESSYLIQSCYTAVELRDKFKSILGKFDKLYVGKVSAPAAWFGLDKEVSNWIISKLTESDE